MFVDIYERTYSFPPPRWDIHLDHVSLFKTYRFIFLLYTLKVIYLYPFFSLFQENGTGKYQIIVRLQ